MAKGHGINLDRKAAEAIARKLKAELEQGAKHIRATIRHKGQWIATFGIRRGKDVGHDYIPSQIFVTNRQARQLADCSMSYDEYIAALYLQGKLRADSPPNPPR